MEPQYQRTKAIIWLAPKDDSAQVTFLLLFRKLPVETLNFGIKKSSYGPNVHYEEILTRPTFHNNEGLMVEISISLSLHCGKLTLINLFDEYQILVSHFSTNAIPQFLKLTIQATIRDRWEIHACLHKMTIMCMAKVICLLTINIYIGHNFL